MSDPTPIFAADGPLAAAIPGFRARPQQIEMAQKIAEALRENGSREEENQATANQIAGLIG